MGYDTIVVGVGGVGSAAVAHLARRGVDVLGLERHDIPHAQGSSHGVTRIIRLPQFEDPAYVPLVRDALAGWQELEETAGRELFYRTGTLDFGPPDSEVVTGSLASCDRHDIEHTTLRGADLSERFPGYDVPASYRGVYQSEGGFLHAEQCTVAHVQAAHAAGATVRARERVIDWEADRTGVRVETDRDAYEADSLVVTAGAWTGQLLPAVAPYLTPERQVLGWFQPSAPENFTPETFPVFVADVEAGNFYGFPTFEVPGFKLGKHHHRGETGHPETLADEPTRADEELLRGFVEGHAPAANGPTMQLATCLYTNTPDREFLIDTHPNHENVVIGAGFSGHGFKFVPVVGEMLADLTLAGTSSHPVDRFGVDRFD